MKIFVFSNVKEPLREKLRASLAGHHVVFGARADENQKSEAFQQAEYLLGNPPVSWFTDYRPQNLKFWQIDSAGFDQYKSVKTTAMVANMGDWFARPCAETIVGGILALYRGLNQLALLKNKKEWVGEPIRPSLSVLNKKKILVLGYGHIGQTIKEILTGFRAEVKVLARNSPEADFHKREELWPFLAVADIVINSLPGSTGLFVDEEFLSKMKKGSVYANIGRGSTTDESVLTELLRSQKLGGAVLDVTAKEPLPAASPLWAMPHVVLTQHTGGGQMNEDDGKVDIFLENVSLLSAGKEIINKVDLSRGY